ncbi:MAG: hypothetical protein KDD60_03065, partial [Bdellovibrionales bacterium]|nr:hypothetical protein [Bdellovibrionales bacterium]
GYKNLISGLRKLKDETETHDKEAPVDKKSSAPSLLELNLDGNSFFINLSDVVVVCKEPCRSFLVKHSK